MSDFYEIDFLPVHTSKSGDAIALRYTSNGYQYIHVVDGGYYSTGPTLAKHITKYYGQNGQKPFINYVVVTHPDQDHAEGLQTILEEFDVGELWMLCPWHYIDQLIDRFARFTNLENLKARLKEDYPYIAKLEEIATRRNILIYEPFQGATIGMFTVLTPSVSRYFDLVVTSTKTPAEASSRFSASGLFAEAVRLTKSFIRAAWGDEYFPSGGTSNENEMSVVQYAVLCNERVLLTADTGRDGLAEAADYAPLIGLNVPGDVIQKFQIPHHGGRHNVSTEILDRWIGKRLATPPAEGTGHFTAIVSSAKEDEAHPRKVVVRAFIHRGGKVITTEEGVKRVGRNAPAREGWVAVTPEKYPDDMEED